MGGNVLANSASYDALPAFLALDAVAHFEDSKGSWSVPIENLTKTKQSGLLTAIEFPIGDSRVFSMDRSLKPVTSVAISAEFSCGLFKNIRVGIDLVCDPNGSMYLRTIRDIKGGEEITVKYTLYNLLKE